MYVYCVKKISMTCQNYRTKNKTIFFRRLKSKFAVLIETKNLRNPRTKPTSFLTRAIRNSYIAHVRNLDSEKYFWGFRFIIGKLSKHKRPRILQTNHIIPPNNKNLGVLLVRHVELDYYLTRQTSNSLVFKHTKCLSKHELTFRWIQM